jgi:GT2 family glycosyltransferase
MRASPGDVTVLTVAANSGEALLNWRDAWTPAGCRLLLADNGSSDGFPEKSGVPVIQTGGNQGFGHGVNAAVLACDTPLVIVTNPDTVPETPSSLAALLEFHREGTLSGAVLLDGSGNPVASGGRWPTVPWVAAQVFRRARPLSNGTPPNWVQGALICSERSVFLNSLGGFHRGFPLYFEDVDLCARALAKSIQTRFCEGARFVHREGTGAPRAGAVRLACFHWGMWKWFDLNRPGSSDAVRRLVMLKCLVRMGVFSRSSPEWQGYAAALTALRRRVAPKLPRL